MRLPIWPGRRRIVFTTSLPSDLPGAVFKAKVEVRWLAKPGIPAHVVRSAIRREASAVTSALSVLDVDDAADAVQTKMDVVEVSYLSAKVDVKASVELRTEPDSKRLADQRLEDRRQWQAWQQNHRAWLTFLRDEVFADEVLAPIWWMQQRPELISAVGKQTFMEAADAAKVAHTATRSGHDAIVQIIEDLIARIGQDERRLTLALQVLDKTLETFGYSDLRQRFIQLESGLSAGGDLSPAGLTAPAPQHGVRDGRPPDT
jgi:hypothetical protein